MTRVNRRIATEVGIAAGVWAALGGTLAIATSEPLWIVGAIFPAAGIGAAMHFAGVRGLVAGMCFLLIAPGVLGEGSLILTMIALAGLAAIALTYAQRSRTQRTTAALYVACFLALAVAIVMEGLPHVALAHLVAGGVAVLVMTRADFAVAAIRGLACLLAAFALSYAITLVIGFEGHQLALWQLDNERELQIYPPLTLATWGGPPFIPGSARLSPLVGEPGLAMYFVVPILALVLSGMRGRTRMLAVGGVLLGAVFTQATGSLIALAAGLVVLGVAHVAITMRRPVRAAMLTLAAMALAIPMIYLLLVYKAGGGAIRSLIDRGFLGGAYEPRAGNANVIVAYLNDPSVAIAVTCALVAVGIAAVRRPSPIALSAFVTFAIVSAFAQPSQWQIGAWLLLAMSMTLAVPADHEPRHGLSSANVAQRVAQARVDVA